MAGPRLPNISELISAGINPKTGLPIKMGNVGDGELKNNIKKFLRLVDEQDAVNRYTWYNLPGDLTGQEIERMLYYKGQLCFFYYEPLEKFFFMPYALDGSIDFYGRFNRVHPVPFISGKDDEKTYKAQEDALSLLKLNCKYGLVLENDGTDDDLLTKSCVLLHDYSKQLAQTIIPRQIVNDALLDVEADMIPFMRTALLAGTGIKGLRVQDADQQDAVEVASRSLEKSALNSRPWIPVVGAVDFQELTDGQLAKAEEYMMAMQSLDNFRLSGYGLDNGGLFEKKAHILNAENEVNQSNVGLILQDGLSIRQNFCNIVNSIWGLGIWCEPSQNEVMQDLDGDGKMYDSNEGESSGLEGGDEQ